ncbi:MAG: T9SS type A sorting domain-containing protein [Calditrichaeota bacterium]|nr:T9SS type A sorting domain-containing protein [Calditrichota bacterium]
MLKEIYFLLLILPFMCSAYINPGKITKITASDTLKIHPIGDSITRGKEGDTYRQYLRKKIINDMQMEVDFVGSCPHAPDSKANWADYPAAADSLDHDLEHDGWGGLKIHQIINSAGNTQGYPAFTIEDLLTEYPSDIILLIIGTNDIYFDYEVKSAPAKLDTLVRKILSNTSAHLIVSSIPPTNQTAINDRINYYNTSVEATVTYYKSQGKNISYIDINSTMSSSDLLSDYVHPNSEGNKKIADGFFKEIDSAVTAIDTRKTMTPMEFELQQNYPNPFNSSTIIRFSIPKAVYVTLKIYDILGEEIRTCISENLNSGSFKFHFDGNDLSSGQYFYHIIAGDYAATKRLVLLK